MIKKGTAILILLFANILLLASTVVPHHHHDGHSTCFILSHCLEDPHSDMATGSCSPSGTSHSSPSHSQNQRDHADCCVRHNTYVVSAKSGCGSHFCSVCKAQKDITTPILPFFLLESIPTLSHIHNELSRNLLSEYAFRDATWLLQNCTPQVLPMRGSPFYFIATA